MKLKPIQLLFQIGLASWLAIFLTSCGGGGDDTASDDPSEEEEDEVIFTNPEDFYAAEPEKYMFKTIGDLPAGLNWVSNMDEAEMGSEEAKKGGTYYYYTPDFPLTIRKHGPSASTAFRDYLLDANGGPGGMSMTVRHPQSLKPVPCLATEWAVSDDGKTVYFKIDPEASYSDGVKVTADDFFFAFYYRTHPWVEDPWGAEWFVTKYTNITKYDDLTISFTFSEAKPDVVYWTGIGPVPRHFYEDFDEDYLEKYNWRFEPTTGPYSLVEEDIKEGRSITFRRVKDWWAKDRKFYKNRFNADNIHIRAINDRSQTLELLKKGELTYLEMSTGDEWHRKVADDDPLVANGYLEKVMFYNQRPRAKWGLRMNSTRPLLNNRDIRLGIQHALNWDTVNEEIFFGDNQRLQGFADGYPDAAVNPDIRAREFDPAKAREYFAKAGFTEAGPDGILTNANGQRLSVALTIGHPWARDIGVLLKDEASNAGLSLDLDFTEFTSAMKKASQKKHDLIFSGYGTFVELYPRFFDFFHSTNSFHDAYTDKQKPKADTNNTTMTAIKELDVMIDQYRGMTDLDEIYKLSREIQVLIHDDAAFAPGWKKPFYRIAKWRWMRFPEETQDEKTAYMPIDHSVFWIDEEMEAETKAAMKSGETFPPSIKVYDQWKQD